MNFLDQFKAARRVSTPLIAVRTPDPAATIGLLTANVNGAPILQWDIAAGLKGFGDKGREVVSAICDGVGPEMLTNPTEFLQKATKVPENTIIFFHNHPEFLKEPTVVQAIWNLRDQFKADKRCLVLLCPMIQLPAFITNDVVVMDEPLPTNAQLEDIIRKVYKAANIAEPVPKVLAQAADATSGLPAFAAEQVLFMSLTKDGLDMESVWERKRQAIEQAPGLSVWRGKEKFSDIGGCTNCKTFTSRITKGQDSPGAVVFIDEIEKALAGSGPVGDTSGTSQEMLGTLLTFMQDRKSTGMLFIGPPGAAKSAMAKAIGNEAGIPTICFDLSGMKGSLVGESGANIRSALKVVDAVAQQRALFIATCNSIGALPPELRRRFKFGTFFFDLPDADERALIWNIYLKKYKVKDQKKPADVGWTGAEIEQCCDIARRIGSTLEEAATFIVPVAKAAAEQIANLRRQADGRFISASKPGVYRFTDAAIATQPGAATRQVTVRE